jgi:hypothetical protein
MWHRTIAAFVAFLLSVPSTAYATGGVWCDAEDANLAFHAKASQSRDGTGAWFGIEGYVRSKVAGLPTKLSNFDVKDENITERWADRDDVRLKIDSPREGDSPAGLQLVVIAKAVEEAVYEGRYELRIIADDSTTLTERFGKVTCSAD